MSTTPSDERCQHLNFRGNVDVTRLTDTEGGPVKNFAADIRVNCADCNMPFQWKGLNMGLSVNQPMVSLDRLELRAPLIPLEEL